MPNSIDWDGIDHHQAFMQHTKYKATAESLLTSSAGVLLLVHVAFEIVEEYVEYFSASDGSSNDLLRP